MAIVKLDMANVHSAMLGKGMVAHGYPSGRFLASFATSQAILASGSAATLQEAANHNADGAVALAMHWHDEEKMDQAEQACLMLETGYLYYQLLKVRSLPQNQALYGTDFQSPRQHLTVVLARVAHQKFAAPGECRVCIIHYGLNQPCHHRS